MLWRIDLLKNVSLFPQTTNFPSRNRGCLPVKGLNADASWVALLAFCAVEQIEDLSILSHSFCGAGIRHSLAGFSTLGLKGRPSCCQLSCILIWRLNWERTSFRACLAYWQNHFPVTVELRAVCHWLLGEGHPWLPEAPAVSCWIVFFSVAAYSIKPTRRMPSVNLSASRSFIECNVVIGTTSRHSCHIPLARNSH